MPSVMDFPPALCRAKGTMQLLVWQHDTLRVAHYTMCALGLLWALPDAHDDADSASDSDSEQDSSNW